LVNAYGEVNEKVFYVVIVGFAGALLMFAGDMLLYYTPEDFAYDSKSSYTPPEMDVSFEPRNPFFTQTGSRPFTKGDPYYCVRRMDKLDFRSLLFGRVVGHSMIISSKR
jgi:hypothetical protein